MGSNLPERKIPTVNGLLGSSAKPRVSAFDPVEGGILQDNDSDYLRLENSAKFKPTDFSKDLKLHQQYHDTKGRTANPDFDARTEYETSHNDTFRQWKGVGDNLNTSIASGTRFMTNSKQYVNLSESPHIPSGLKAKYNEMRFSHQAIIEEEGESNESTCRGSLFVFNSCPLTENGRVY